MLRRFFFLLGAPIVAFLALAYVSCLNNASPQSIATIPAPVQQPDSQMMAFLADYKRFFAESMRSTQTPGAAVVIVRGDSVIFSSAFGVKKTGTKDSVDVNTVFRIGSLSKGFAGVLTGILVQQGLLQWNQKVQDCFPQFTLRDAKQARRMQLWHLLSHTTGLPYHAFTNLIEEGFSIRKIVLEYFPKAPVSGVEGEFFSYQNAAFCVIEEVMKATTDKSYPELLRENVFVPAHMTTASCDFNTMQQCKNKALPHFGGGYSWHSDTISPLYYNAAAAGGVNASITDMGEWLKVLLGHKPQVVADTTLDKVFTPIVSTDKERRILPRWIGRDEAFYALGWRVLKHDNHTIIYHGGYVNGFRGEIAFDRQDDIGICVLFNAATDLSNTCIPAFFERWKKVK